MKKKPFIVERKNNYLLSTKILRIMKISIFLFLLTFMQVLAIDSYSQKTKLSLDMNNATVEDVLNKIETQSEFFFLFSPKMVDVTRKVNIKLEGNKIDDALNQLFNGTEIAYLVIDRQIVLSTHEQMVPFITAIPQEITITGKVIDEDGNPLPGVNIIIKGTATGTITDVDGNYSIQVDDPEVVLVFTFIGMLTQEVVVGSQTSINVTMEPDVLGLEEVIVIGYGSMKKSDLTGAVGSVDNEEIMERPAINLTQQLATRIAGLHVQTNSGVPGGNVKTVIRGYNSYNASNDPLYVVDGVIWPDGITSLNPNDIERVDVLKDASSTAIYGTRGSNGVIQISTKRGSAGGQVRYDTWMGVNWTPEYAKVDACNAAEFLFIEELEYANAPKFDPAGFAAGNYIDPVQKRMNYLVGNTLGNRELFELDANGVPQPIYDINWQDESTRTTVSQGHNLSFTGGNELSNYGLFLGYTDDQGIVKRSFAKRYNVRAVVDHQIKDWLKVGGTVSFARLNDEGFNDANTWNITRQFVEMVPFIPYKYDDGAYGWGKDYKGLEGHRTPLSMINEQDWNNKTNRFGGNTYVTLRIIPGLELTSTLGANATGIKNKFFQTSEYPGSSKNQTTISGEDETFVQWSNMVNYTKRFGVDHSINALGGIELQKYDLYTTRIEARDGDDYFKWNNLSNMVDQRASRSSATDYKMQSYFGRINYNFQDKYLLTATGRYDGSSRFGADNKFAFFPSAAVAWRVSEESFLNNSNVISNLKLRASYGLTGNSEIGSYKSQANLGTNAYVFGGSRVTGAAVDRLANPELRWEKSAEFNVGVDMGLLNNRISFEVEYYDKNTTGLLFDAPVPATSWYTFVTKNIGSMESKGIELSLNTVNISELDFSWSTDFNLSTVHNVVTALGEGDEDILYGFKSALILRVGEAAGSFFGYLRDGCWGTAEAGEAAEYGKLPGDVKTVDQNNDGQINAEDRVIIGKGQPDFYGGLSNTVRYKAFDLIVELAFWYGNEIFNNNRNSGEARTGIANTFATVLDAWTPENQDAILEQVRPTKAYYTYNMDTRNVFDGSFLRGKNLSLGYTLPHSVSSKWGLNDLRISVAVQNFFIICEYTGFDPESSNHYDNDPISQGVSYGGYPRPRTFVLGLNVGF